MSDDEGQSSTGQDRPTLPPIRVLFRDALALPAHPGAGSTISDLRDHQHAILPQQIRQDGVSHTPRPPSLRHSSGLEMTSATTMAASSRPATFMRSSHYGQGPPPHLVESERRFSAPEPVLRSRSWSETTVAYRRGEVPQLSPHGSIRGPQPAMNPYPPEFVSTSNQAMLSPPMIGQSLEGSANINPKYDCPFCPKSFARPSSLKIHINSHTGERPFLCPVEGCGKTFSVLSNMRRHARSAHRSPDQANTIESGSSSVMHSRQQEVSTLTEDVEEDDDQSIIHEHDERS